MPIHDILKMYFGHRHFVNKMCPTSFHAIGNVIFKYLVDLCLFQLDF